MREKNNIIPSIILVVKKLFLFLFILVFGIYFLSGNGATPYDYFTRLADSFLKGKFYLSQPNPWLSELIAGGLRKYYVVFPPMPSIVLMPFRLFFGNNFRQDYLANLLGAGTVVMTMAMAWKIKKDVKLLIWTGLLTGFGTIIWFMSAVGSGWYLGQITGAFFLTAALFTALYKKHPFLIGILLGAAFLSRLHIILSIPLFIYLLNDKNRLNNYKNLALGILPFILFNFFYNYIRFGVIWDKAYTLMPDLIYGSAYPKGVVSLSYIPEHLKVIFTYLPVFFKDFPYIFPNWHGLAIWITTPAFVYAFFASRKEKLVQLSWLSIFLISIVIFSHYTTGFAQFGYRFAVDFYPILLFLTIKGAARTGLTWHHWLLLALSLVVNLWGVYSMHLFGWPCC